MAALFALIIATQAAAAAAAPPCDPASCFSPAAPTFNTSAFSSWLLAREGRALSVAPGIYTLAPPAAGARAHLDLPPLAGTAVSFAGVTLVAAARAGAGVYLSGWRGSALAGLSLRYAQPPSSSATIAAVDAAAGTVDVTVEAGHPADDFIAGTVASCNVFEAATRQRRPLAQDVYVKLVAARGGGVYRLTVANAGQLAGVVAGDLLGCRVAGGGMTFTADGAEGCAFSNISLYGGPCFGFFESGGSNNSWTDIAIRFPDPPPGAAAAPLLSTSADGLHSAGTRIGPRIERAHFEGMDDDGIAIHGAIRLVTGAAGAAVWTAVHGAVAPGDRVLLYDTAFGPAPALAAPDFAAAYHVVVAVAPAAKGYAPPFNVSKTMPSQVLPGATFDVLTLDPPPPAGAGFDWVLINADAVGAGFVVRDSTIRNHRARGLLLKGSDGLVENVNITNSSLGGIIITPELYWTEAGYARNVTVRGCAITLTSSGAQSYGGIALGAVAPGGALVRGAGHAHVTIENNVITDAGYAPVWLNGAADVTLRGNRLVTPFHAPDARGLPHCCLPLPAPSSVAVWADAVEALRIEGNCVVRASGGVNFALLNVTASSGSWAGGVVACT